MSPKKPAVPKGSIVSVVAAARNPPGEKRERHEAIGPFIRKKDADGQVLSYPVMQMTVIRSKGNEETVILQYELDGRLYKMTIDPKYNVLLQDAKTEEKLLDGVQVRTGDDKELDLTKLRDQKDLYLRTPVGPKHNVHHPALFEGIMLISDDDLTRKTFYKGGVFRKVILVGNPPSKAKSPSMRGLSALGKPASM
jgi:hypothetical protein